MTEIEELEKELNDFRLGGLHPVDVAQVHELLDKAGIPNASHAVCDDVRCNSKIYHRVKRLIDERDMLKSAAQDSGELIKGAGQAMSDQLKLQQFGYREERLPHIMYRAFRDAMKDWLNEHPEYMKTVQRIET